MRAADADAAASAPLAIEWSDSPGAFTARSGAGGAPSASVTLHPGGGCCVLVVEGGESDAAASLAAALQALPGAAPAGTAGAWVRGEEGLAAALRVVGRGGV